MIIEAIKELCDGKNLSYEMAAAVMDEIMNGEATDAQKAAYLTAMHIKGETIDEITASAMSMRKHCLKFNAPEEVIDIVGTGGDGASSINVSTIAALITAAAGSKVTKHGNRAASSKCGTADVLEKLGVRLDVEEKKLEEVLDKTGFAFMFAQKYHSAMRYVGGVRREIKIPTIFNILGPLANPASADLQLLGVYSDEMVEPLAHVLSNLGVKRGMVVHGKDGFDEISMSGATTVCEFNNGSFKSYEITPEQFGFTRCEKQDVAGGSPDENAQIVKDILTGKLEGAKLDIVLLNAGAALHITKNISIEEGIEEARQIIKSRKAYETLENVIKYTN